MSRHTFTMPNKTTLVIGFDKPLQEYFAELWLNYDSDDESCLWSIGSRLTTIPHPDYPDKTRFSNGDLLTIFSQPAFSELIPSNITEALVNDLPF